MAESLTTIGTWSEKDFLSSHQPSVSVFLKDFAHFFTLRSPSSSRGRAPIPARFLTKDYFLSIISNIVGNNHLSPGMPDKNPKEKIIFINLYKPSISGDDRTGGEPTLRRLSSKEDEEVPGLPDYTKELNFLLISYSRLFVVRYLLQPAVCSTLSLTPG